MIEQIPAGATQYLLARRLLPAAAPVVAVLGGGLTGLIVFASDDEDPTASSTIGPLLGALPLLVLIVLYLMIRYGGMVALDVLGRGREARIAAGRAAFARAQGWTFDAEQAPIQHNLAHLVPAPHTGVAAVRRLHQAGAGGGALIETWILRSGRVIGRRHRALTSVSFEPLLRTVVVLRTTRELPGRDERGGRLDLGDVAGAEAEELLADIRRELRFGRVVSSKTTLAFVAPTEVDMGRSRRQLDALRRLSTVVQ